MKQIITICIVLLTSITHLWAQPQQPQRGQGNFHQFQVELITKQLDIDEAKRAKFEEIYTQYSEQMRAMRPKHKRNADGAKPTEAEIEEQILDSFEMAEKSTALKKEYYQKFKTVLSPHQILKMYNIERQISERMNSEMQNRTNRGPNKPENE
ncbi:MAG: hypothetical protein R3Y44_05670 [Rikenellaceae bacterium]